MDTKKAQVGESVKKNIEEKSDSKGALTIIPFGNIDRLILSVVAAHLQTLLGLNADIEPVNENPKFAFISGRRQYDAIKIIGKLARGPNSSLQLGIIGNDLCTPILTFVYGESQLGGKAAVVSIYRLKHYNRQITCERAAKISLHEVGHLLGIGHCRQNFCLMRFCGNLDDLDQLPLTFCSTCDYEINRQLKALIL
jgi:archaemetzincin